MSSRAVATTSRPLVAIDRSYSAQLGVAQVGGKAELKIKGVHRGDDQGHRHSPRRHMFSRRLIRREPIWSSAEQGQLFHCPGRRRTQNAAAVRDRLVASMPDAEVLTSEEFRDRSLLFWLFDTGAGAALLGSAILGVIVGTIIVAQTLYSSAKDHLKEFATLRAIRSSRGDI